MESSRDSLFVDENIPRCGADFEDGMTTVAATTTVRSYMTKAADVQPEWFVVDADAQIVGRLATCIATVLMGKHKPTYTPHVDGGDCVIVLNADKIRMSGRKLPHPTNPNFTGKMLRKEYQRFSGYPGGLKIMSGLRSSNWAAVVIFNPPG